MVGGGFRYHVPVAVPLEHKRVGEMIRALEDRLRLGVVALAVHFDQRDACLALPVQELLDENVVRAVPVDDMRIRPKPVSGRYDPLEPPQGFREPVAQVVQQDPLIRKQGVSHLQFAVAHQMFAQEGDEFPIPRRDVQPARIEVQTIARAEATKELLPPERL